MTEPLQTERAGSCESGACLIVLRGGIDYTSAPRLRADLFEAVEEVGEGPILVDLTAVRSIDTAGMAVLVEALVASEERGGRLLLCGAGEAVRKVFRLAGLQKALESCTSCREEAERRLAQRVC
jgi:anti-anti-sigma factor